MSAALAPPGRGRAPWPRRHSAFNYSAPQRDFGPWVSQPSPRLGTLRRHQDFPADSARCNFCKASLRNASSTNTLTHLPTFYIFALLKYIIDNCDKASIRPSCLSSHHKAHTEAVTPQALGGTIHTRKLEMVYFFSARRAGLGQYWADKVSVITGCAMSMPLDNTEALRPGRL